MGPGYWISPVVFILDTVSSLYLTAVLLRFLLQWSGADFYNPILQALVKVTHPPLKILRRFVPPIGKIDSSSLVLLLVLQMLTDYALNLIQGAAIGFAALLVLALTHLVALLLNVYLFAVLIRAFLSWFASGDYSPVNYILARLTELLLIQCRRLIPDVAGFDLSPILALLILQLAKLIVLPPLGHLAGLLG